MLSLATPPGDILECLPNLSEMNIIIKLTFSLKQGSTKDRVFAVYIYFTKHADEEVCQKAITGLGECIRTWIGFICVLYLPL